MSADPDPCRCCGGSGLSWSYPCIHCDGFGDDTDRDAARTNNPVRLSFAAALHRVALGLGWIAGRAHRARSYLMGWG